MAEIPINRGLQTAPLSAAAECRTDLLSESQIEIAKRAFEEFLTRLSDVIPGYLLTPAEISLAGIEQLLLSEALANHENGNCAIWFTPQALPYRLRLELGGNFVGAALESVLGAPTDTAGAARKSLTDVDLHILRDLIELVGSELRTAWHSTSGYSLEMGSIEIVSNLEAAPAYDPGMVLLKAEIVMRECSGAIHLLVPSFLLRLLSAEQSDVAAKGAERQDPMGPVLDAACVEVEAVLQGARIQFRDLLALRPGKILQLPHKTTAAVECHVNGMAKFRGELVSSDRALGLQIQQ